MNIQQVTVIEGLARAVQDLSPMIGYEKGYATAGKLCDRIDEVLGDTGHAEELKALQASNLIKQANINLLAGKVLTVFESIDSVCGATTDQIHDLRKLAADLRQEEPSLSEVAYAQDYADGSSQVCAPVDPVAQAVESLKLAQAEVFRLRELRKQTSSQDCEVEDAQDEALRVAAKFKDELIKAIEASVN